MSNELYLRKQVENDKPNLGQVGDIVHSILTETQLQSLRGSGWVLMDGRDVTGSAYEEITGDNTIPDARGHFFRSKNNGRNDGNEDPAGERNLGSRQDDDVVDHYHFLMREDSSIVDDSGGGSTNTYGLGDDTVRNSMRTSQARRTSDNAPIGNADETRVKNIAVNYFIKIN